MTQMTIEQIQTYVTHIENQNRYLAGLLTAIIKKHGVEQIIYADGKTPCIELELSKEEYEVGKTGAWTCEQIPNKKTGSIVLKLVRTAPAPATKQ